MTKIFQFLLKKLGITTGYSTFSVEAKKTHVIWSMLMSSSMKAVIHLGPNYLANFEHELRGDLKVQYHSEVDIGGL